MKSLHSLSNHVSGLSAQTIQAGAHAFGTTLTRVRERNIASVPSKSFLGDPLSLSACRRNPDSRLTSLMNDHKRPLCIEFENLAVRNEFSSQGINYFDVFGAQDKFRLYPEQISQSSKNKRAQKFKKSLSLAFNNHEAIGYKESKQKQRSSRPNEITFGAKDFIHRPSIAGESK